MSTPSIDPPAPSPIGSSFISQFQEPIPKNTKPTGAGFLTDPYIVVTKEFMLAIINAGYTYSSEHELALIAQSMTEALINQAKIRNDVTKNDFKPTNRRENPPD